VIGIIVMVLYFVPRRASSVNVSREDVARQAYRVVSYEDVAPAASERALYRCPLCQTETHHEDGNAVLANGLGVYRASMRRIKELEREFELEIALDETDLCRQCRHRGKITAPAKLYIYAWFDNRCTHTLAEVYDLEKIVALLQRDDVWVIRKDGVTTEMPLAPGRPRIRKILGLVDVL